MPHITLREIVTGRTPLQWTEAVAIVQGVCAEALRLAGAGRPAIPSDSDIRLTRDGLFQFTAAGNPNESQVHLAGALLALLLPPGATPVPLRLEAVAAVGPTPHKSLGEFSAALAPFERPNGPEILRATCFRLVEGREPEPLTVPRSVTATPPPPPPEGATGRRTPPPEVVTTWSSRDALATFESESAGTAERLFHRSQRLAERARAAGWRWGAAVATIVIIVALAGAAAWRLSVQVPPQPVPDATPTATVAAPAVPAPPPTAGAATIPVATTPAAAPSAGPRPVAEPAPPPAPADNATAAVGRTRLPAVQRRAAPAPPAPHAADNHESGARSGAPTPNVPVPEPAPAQTAPRGTDRVDEVIYLSPDATPGAPEASAPIYSPADKDVRRPVGIRPRFWYDPPAGIPLDLLTQIEVIVTATGEVESAKIVGGPRSYFDGMFLSAIKAWRFQPATKDGKAVSYRQTIWLLVETAR